MLKERRARTIPVASNNTSQCLLPESSHFPTQLSLQFAIHLFIRKLRKRKRKKTNKDNLPAKSINNTN